MLRDTFICQIGEVLKGILTLSCFRGVTDVLRFLIVRKVKTGFGLVCLHFGLIKTPYFRAVSHSARTLENAHP